MAAIFVLLVVEGYSRPGEFLTLTRGGILPPRGASGHWTLLIFPQEKLPRSKTGQADDTVIMDGSRVPWLRHALAALARMNPMRSVAPLRHNVLYIYIYIYIIIATEGCP